MDEPSLVGYGSAYVQVTREQIEQALALTVGALRTAGALVGIHCCANTDWSLILGSGTDILSFDAFSYFDNLTAYGKELKAFYDRGGRIAFGIGYLSQSDSRRFPSGPKYLSCGQGLLYH